MFTLARNCILAALVACASVASQPTRSQSVVPKSAADIVNVVLYVEIDLAGPNTTLPVSTESCSDFNGAYAYLNKAVSSAIIPSGYNCTFYERFGCDLTGPYIPLDNGQYSDFSRLPPDTYFDKTASSISCAARPSS